MSWDALIMRFGDAKTIDDFPPDFEPQPVAQCEELKKMLHRLLPAARHHDGQSCLEGDDFWLELNYGCHTDKSGNVSAIGVRCNAGRGAIQHLQKICDALNARLLDLQTSEFADFSDATDNSMRSFAEWRDRAISQRQSKQ